jgi:hypothetical protein
MINLIKIEMLKLRTSPAFYATALAALVLSLGASITNVLIKPGHGDPAIGSAANAQDVLSQAGAVRRSSSSASSSSPASTGTARSWVPFSPSLGGSASSSRRWR